MDKYCIRSSTKPEVKSQVATVGRAVWGSLLPQRPPAGRKSTVTSWRNNCCGLEALLRSNTTVLKVNSPSASQEVIDSYSTSVCLL